MTRDADASVALAAQKLVALMAATFAGERYRVGVFFGTTDEDPLRLVVRTLFAVPEGAIPDAIDGYRVEVRQSPAVGAGSS